MEKDREKLNDQLQHLLSICNDGKEGYAKAAENVEDASLKGMFLAYSTERAAFATELKALISQEGGDDNNKEGGPIGKLHRVWIDIKATLSGKDRTAMIRACITGDESALEAYDKVLEEKNLSEGHRTLINKQRQEIAEALLRMKGLEKHCAD